MVAGTVPIFNAKTGLPLSSSPVRIALLQQSVRSASKNSLQSFKIFLNIWRVRFFTVHAIHLAGFRLKISSEEVDEPPKILASDK